MANFGIYIRFLGGYIIHPPHPHLSLRIPRPPQKTVPILRFGPPTLWDLVEAHVAQILLAHAPLIGLPRDRNFRWIPAVGTLGLWLLLEMFFNERNLQETRTVVGPWDTKIPKKQTCWVFRSFFVGQKQERFQWKGLIHEILELWKLPSLETSGRNRRSPHKETKIMTKGIFWQHLQKIYFAGVLLGKLTQFTPMLHFVIRFFWLTDLATPKLLQTTWLTWLTIGPRKQTANMSPEKEWVWKTILSNFLWISSLFKGHSFFWGVSFPEDPFVCPKNPGFPRSNPMSLWDGDVKIETMNKLILGRGLDSLIFLPGTQMTLVLIGKDLVL